MLYYSSCLSQSGKIMYVCIFHCRNVKEKDPTVFTKNSTKLEASACRLQLPEVKRAPDFDIPLIFGSLLARTSNLWSARFVPTPQGASGFYNIDNEEYEAMPVEVRLLPRKLCFFISAERREQLLLQMQNRH